MSAQEKAQAKWQTDEEQLRNFLMRAWLVPMLAGAVTPVETSREPGSSPHSDDNQGLTRHAREDLKAWVEYVASPRSDDPFPVNLKIALAQGFKHVANWRRLNPYLQAEPRYLAEQAETMLHRVDFWYSRLALLHALTLWSLPDRPEEPARSRPAQSPDALVRQWMVMPDSEAERALKNHEVEHPFVADVLVLLNLAEGGRGKGPKERERRLAETANMVLPSCLTGDRSPLDPVRTVGISGRGEGLRPACASDCQIHLCPYPLKGQQSPRAELSEAFCRRQRVILGARGRIGSLRIRLTTPWQGGTKNHLKSFWDDMGRRSRQ